MRGGRIAQGQGLGAAQKDKGKQGSQIAGASHEQPSNVAQEALDPEMRAAGEAEGVCAKEEARYNLRRPDAVAVCRQGGWGLGGPRLEGLGRA